METVKLNKLFLVLAITLMFILGCRDDNRQAGKGINSPNKTSPTLQKTAPTANISEADAKDPTQDPRICKDAEDDHNEDPQNQSFPPLNANPNGSHTGKKFNSAIGMSGNIGGGGTAGGRGGFFYRRARGGSGMYRAPAPEPQGTEKYDEHKPNEYIETAKEKFSTFSIDVDTASYTLVRKKIMSGQLPPKAAVQPEEFLNYFDYGYAQPKGDAAFAVYTETAQNPYNPKTALLRIGIQGRIITNESRKPVHLTFLVDVSGSMNWDGKLKLVKKTLAYLTNQLTEKDTIAICTYAGTVKTVLEPTACSAENKQSIIASLRNLHAGGSTAGEAGLKLAYSLAEKNLIPEDVNRIILCTDGDFNVGINDGKELVKMVAEKKQQGILITALGFGTGNYNAKLLERFSNKVNGNHFYIDKFAEAERLFGKNLAGTLEVIAGDVKIQVEFNEKVVEKYRLIGYENRMLTKQQFRDDKVDAGEVGSGQKVTAMYELFLKDDAEAQKEKNLGILRLRYKHEVTDARASEHEFEIANKVLEFAQASKSFKFATAVAGFADSLRESKFAKTWRLSTVLDAAKAGDIPDEKACKEFIELVRKAISLRDK